MRRVFLATYISRTGTPWTMRRGFSLVTSSTWRPNSRTAESDLILPILASLASRQMPMFLAQVIRSTLVPTLLITASLVKFEGENLMAAFMLGVIKKPVVLSTETLGPREIRIVLVFRPRVKKSSLGESVAGSHAYNPIRDSRRDSWRDLFFLRAILKP